MREQPAAKKSLTTHAVQEIAWQPRLSTIEYPVRRMSEVAFSLLMDPRKPDAPAPVVELPPRILWGDSL